jgi:hypothetical protein
MPTVNSVAAPEVLVPGLGDFLSGNDKKRFQSVD